MCMYVCICMYVGTVYVSMYAHTHTHITCYYIISQLMCTSQLVHTSLASAAPPILLFDLGGAALARLSTCYIS